MKEKLEKKIEEEIDKILKREDFTIDEIKTMIEIKNGFEMKEILNKALDNRFILNKKEEE